MPSDATPAEHGFRRIAVIGLGVMGGSVARAVSRRLPETTVVGWSPEAAERRAAQAEVAIHEAADSWQDAVHGADLVVLAMPLRATCDIVQPLAPHLHPDATLADVASLKAPVARAVHEANLGRRWVGCHPMVGSERSGFDASSADLYEGARVWTVSETADDARYSGVAALWHALGATTHPVTAEEHDRAMAVVSHLPQLTANALASVLAGQGVAPESLGSGARDMTRLAASNPTMWKDILALAPHELPDGLRALARRLEEIAGLVADGDAEALETLMSNTRAWREEP